MVGPTARVYVFPFESVTEEIVAPGESYSTVAMMRFPVVLAAPKACDTVVAPAPAFVAACWTNAGVALVLLRKLPAWTLTPARASVKTCPALAFAVEKFIVKPSGFIDTKVACLVMLRPPDTNATLFSCSRSVSLGEVVAAE